MKEWIGRGEEDGSGIEGRGCLATRKVIMGSEPRGYIRVATIGIASGLFSFNSTPSSNTGVSKLYQT